MLEKLAKSIEEVNVLAEHYRTCQNVAAIESLAKECFISKEDTDAFIAVSYTHLTLPTNSRV